jgi:hypothetical protein
MGDSSSSTPAPEGANAARRFVSIVTILILLSPVAALAAGAGAFVGISVAVIGWGKEAVGDGAAVGAGVGVLLVLAWAVLFVSRARVGREASQVHAGKLAAYFQDMQSQGMNAEAPVVFRLLWMLGLKVPPPLFLGRWGSFLYPFGVYAPIVLTAGAVLWWQHPNYPPWTMLVTACFFLVLVIAGGIYNVKATRSIALKLQLPSWDQYAAAPARDVANSGPKGDT